MKDTKEVDLGEGSVGKLLVKLAVPAITAQVVNVLYNIVDRMYIGHIPETGPVALTGVGVCMPLILAVSAFAALFSMGGAPRAAIALGRKDKEEAEKILGNCFAMLVTAAVVLTILIEVFGHRLLYMFGASDNTIPYAWSYMKIYGAGTIFVQLALGLNAFINTQGYAGTGMLTVLIGAICNTILDPIFIFVFGMGTQGAATATIISQAISAGFVIWFLTSKRSYLHLQKKYFKLEWKIAAPCLMLGASPFVMQLTESVINICFNKSLLMYGGDIAVGAMSILASVMQFAMLPLQGLTQGSQPIISYNYGAGKITRIKKTFRLLLLSCIFYSFSLWAICEFAPQLMAAIFTADEELGAYTRWAMRTYMAACCIFGAQIACQQTFVALGKAKISLFLAILRKIILLVPLIFLVPLFVQDKAFGVFLAEPIADTIAVMTTCISFTLFYRKLGKKQIEK